ncbi:DUF4238 domain-containing protein [Herbaspirillum chlorophenolicum]|uniref:DUF4238 domain-containing protein n=1 Tax=Herbaspirillum chlorophenolicum TaxID=211589 RepID=UPI00067B4B0C|nr:DUF4238 domain-containing protein [Herbaspirillum chlorophenolicum]
MPSNPPDIKKRHHHVWAHYLARWGNGTKNVFYTTSTGKTICDSVRSFASDDYFYKATKLDTLHVRVIQTISRNSPEHLQRMHMSLLSHFLEAQDAEALYRMSSVTSHEVEHSILAMSCNTLENLHTDHEIRARPILDGMATGSLDVLQSEESMIAFLAFFGQQVFRTKALRDNALRALSRSTTQERLYADAMEHAWWFISYMSGTNLGFSLYNDRHASRHALLINDTSVPFITSDQPIVNVHECVSETEFSPPKYADFYYPISPRVAFVVCDSERFSSGINQVDELTAREFNTKIATQAMVHIVGDTADSIRQFKKYIGRRYLKIADARR